MSDPSDPTHDDRPADEPGFRSAEDFLASLGVEREPIRVAAPPPDVPAPDAPPVAPPATGEAAGSLPRHPDDGRVPDDGRTPVGAREAARLATEAPAPLADAPGEHREHDAPRDLGDEVARAVAYARRSTAQAPKSEGRLRGKLAARDYPRVVIDRAIERCRAEGIVDDAAYAKAFVEERRRKGHAPFRIQQDLRKRGFDDALIARALEPIEEQDREAQAFDAARGKARSLRGVEADTAFRRLVGYLARRGYPEGLARKVAREVVYADREAERTAGH